MSRNIKIKCSNCGKSVTTQLKNKQGFFEPQAIKHHEIKGWLINLKRYSQSTCPDCNLFKKNADESNIQQPAHCNQ